MIAKTVLDRAWKIKLLLMDVDGVLTDGRLYPIPDGRGGVTETKGFNAQDGIGLQWCHWVGLETGVISGRDSLATTIRAAQCKMKYVYQGHIEKLSILEKILTQSAHLAEEVAYMGDDFTDIPVFHRVGLAIATANAREEVKQQVNYITHARGGDGAVREVVELLLQAQGRWEEILKKYEISPTNSPPQQTNDTCS
ncbi:MAG: HAD hydrolase family protein [Acidobacteria bacterium]|nr:HAD hydrolase family protein [Acidobacteriota bacterium]MBI3657104.1 HAD hydrolase family protein [Acidobacteriota bacterium]